MIQLSEKHLEYWRKNIVIVAILLTVWFVVTYVQAWFARGLNEISFFGWPFSFYVSAQGALIVYCLIIWVYWRYMNHLDAKYGVQEVEE